jgi:hypothetical protein
VDCDSAGTARGGESSGTDVVGMSERATCEAPSAGASFEAKCLNVHCTEGWTALAGVCGVLLALGAALVGGRQLQEARRLRIEQAQPYVAVYADVSPASSAVFDLVIKNFGRTPATNVRVDIKPALGRAAYGDELVELPPVIPTLVPGQEWRTFWDTQMARKDSSLPNSYAVDVRFSDTTGKPAFCLQFELDWHASTQRDVVDVSSTSHDAAKALQDIRTILKNAMRQGALNVLARDGDARDEQEQARFEQRRRDLEAEQSGD